jgi:hypothetical protein
MKFIVLLFIFLSQETFASREAICDLTNGFYDNSYNSLTDLKFSTLVDVFTINNAQTVSMKLDGKDLRFTRSDLRVTRQSQLIFFHRKGDQVLRSLYMNIDRTPRQVSLTKEFYGNMVISPELEPGTKPSVHMKRSLVYNFYCRF